jgi:hypothetical protein
VRIGEFGGLSNLSTENPFIGTSKGEIKEWAPK